MELDGRAQSHYGVAQEQLPIAELLAKVHSDDLPTLQRAMASALDPIAQGPVSVDYRVVHGNGEVKWLSIHGLVIFGKANGRQQPIMGVGTTQDITKQVEAEAALQESQARFQALADNMSQLAWMADGSGWITWYNRRWYEYTGTTFEEMQAWGWQKVHHPDHLERVVKGWRAAHVTGGPWEDMFPLRGRDGRYRWFLSRAMPIRDAAGHVARWFGTNTDVTALRDAEEEIRRLLAEAQQREQELSEKQEQLVQAAKMASLGELASGIAHELNNPLNNIGLAVGNVLDRLRMASLDPVVETSLVLAQREVAKAAKIVDHLRTFARKPKAVVEPVSLNQVVRQSVHLLETQMTLRGITLHTR